MLNLMFSAMACFSQPAVAYVSAVGNVAVQPDLAFGDVPVPKGYRHAVTGPHAKYWRDAIDKELRGLLQQQTFDYLLILALQYMSKYYY